MTVDNTERALEPVASFDAYADAERAVDRLADERFPVDRMQIVGRDVSLVEDVTGRRSYDRAGSEGALSGALVAGFAGLLLGLLNWVDPLIGGLRLGLYGVVLGAAVGALVGLLVQALTSGRRDFSSTRSLKATRYDILADAEVAEDARARLVSGGAAGGTPSRPRARPERAVVAAAASARRGGRRAAA
jgi:hypothetical protein